MAWEVRTTPVLETSRQQVQLPAWRRIQQSPTHHGLASVADAVREQFRREDIASRIRPGMRVAVGAGSRGIGCLQEVVRATVLELRQLGAEPFVVPAMGSHGGGTAEGQRAVLAAYGITEEGVGAPVRASMETVELGTVLDGIHIFTDRTAFTEADAIVPVARVKPHTDFRYRVESGLHKMLTIGFGKHRGASNIHTYPLERFGEIIEAAGQFILTKVNVPFGIAIVEDAYEQPGIVEAVPGDHFDVREAELLETAKSWLARLPFSEADVLIVQELGKDVSGAGMDPNVTGRFADPGIESSFRAQWLLFLDLTADTHGNAAGLGFADVTTRRAAEKIDVAATYMNQVTSQILQGAKLPLVAESDQEAVAIACSALRRRPPEQARIAWIKNTLELLELHVSEPLWQDIAAREDVRALGEPEPIRFDGTGSLLV
ncbi:MAG: DUF362 domain-containing protein [Candidatus Dormiibacterota bacterium]